MTRRGYSVNMKMFNLVRSEDVSGVSGTGRVAEGVEFSDGVVVIRWLTDLSSTAIYKNRNELVAIHGHDGRTVVQWV